MDMTEEQRGRRETGKHFSGAAMLSGAHPWKILWLVLTGLIAAILTGAGFFFDSVPFALAYTPFLMALVTPARGYQAALVAGHFAIVFEIAATGLVHMGFSGWLVMFGFLFAVSTLSAGFAVFGVGLAAVILLLIPYFPGNPLLVTGALYPGFGIGGIILLAAACIAVAYWKTTGARLVAVLLTIALPSAVVHGAVNNGLFNIPLADRAALTGLVHTASGPDENNSGGDRFERIALSRSDTRVITGTDLTWRLLLALRNLPAGSLVITGENVLTSEDAMGQRILCRRARAEVLDLYVGIASADGTGEIWRLSAETCPAGSRVYRAVIGIPGLTGPAWPDAMASATATGAPVNLPTALDGAKVSIGFLACFEAFSLHRWIAMGLSDFETVAVVSNDHWTDPLPVALLRTKVSDQFAKLFGIKVVHAGRDKNILILKGKNPERFGFSSSHEGKRETQQHRSLNPAFPVQSDPDLTGNALIAEEQM